jgi:hypothetical protein
VAQKEAEIKRYTPREQLQPRFPAYAPDFLRNRGKGPNRTVALGQIPKRLFDFFGSDMRQIFDFTGFLIDQMVPIWSGRALGSKLN